MSVNAGTGLLDFPFSSARGFWRWVEMCEEGGVDSIWQSDRVVSREPVLEVMSVMAALAGATKRIKFGMNVASVALRDPLLLAKQCATIDYLSGGRLLPAFGVGSPRAPEWQVMGLSFKGSGLIADEGMQVIARLWKEDSVTFHGKHFHFENASISPRPVQKELPLWVGGSSEVALKRTARLGTGWQASAETPEEVRPLVQRIKALTSEYGRSIDYDHFGIGIAYRFGNWDEPAVARQGEAYRKRTGRDPSKAFAVGDGKAIVERIRQYVDAGIHKFVLRPVGTGDEDLLDQTRRMIAEVLPGVAEMNKPRAA